MAARRLTAPPRRAGADNDSVLKSVGYSDADLAAFKAAGVI